MANASPWQLDDSAAQLVLGRLSGELKLDCPDLGLTALQCGGESIGGSLWGWTAFDPTLQKTGEPAVPPRRDAYIRGNDLVLTYGPTASCKIETTVYWRADTAAERLSLLVSIRTQLLDTQPVVHVRSQREAEESAATPSGEPFLVQHHLAGGLTICEACHPDDQSVLLADQPASDVAWQLFSHFLEKGVIRRARMSMTIADTANADAAAQDLRATLLAEPLPLTT